MQSDNLVSIIHGVIILAAMWFLVFRCLAPAMLDSFRDELFQIRHDLFELAERGVVSFEDDSYRRFRNHLNTYLGLAHCVNASMLLVDGAPHAGVKTGPLHLIRGLPEPAMSSLLQLNKRLRLAVLLRIATSSVVALPILFIAVMRVKAVAHHEPPPYDQTASGSVKELIDSIEPALYRSVKTATNDHPEASLVG